MKRKAYDARQFLDIEAVVSDEDSTDEEGEVDLQDPFIDTATDDGEEIFYNSLRDDENEEDTDTLFEGLLSRAYLNAAGSSGLSDTDARHRYTDPLVFVFDSDDLPLWKVSCQIGHEERVVSALSLVAKKHHQLRSAFTRGSIRGHIYLECNMNDHLVHLLKRIPSILRTKQGVLRSIIKQEEQVGLLRMVNVDTNTVEAGNWVQVKKGLYKGDIGLVEATHTWGIDLLLVPRLAFHMSANKRKRKASAIRINPALFDPVAYEQALSVKIPCLQDGSYTLGRLRFVSGLVAKTFDHHSISSVVRDIPWGHFTMFILSKHPKVNVASMPRPSEWIFAEEERVIIRPSCKSGVLKSIGARYAEVEIDEEGTFCFPWMDVRKAFNVGDFVCAMDGDPRGSKGWVIELKDDIAAVCCVDEIMDGDQMEVQANSPKDVKLINFHVNCLRATGKPQKLAFQSSAVYKSLEKHIRHPWCGKHIIIAKIGHAQKGATAEIIDVLSDQKTSTGIKLVVQLTRYNPHAPFSKITVDSGEVVEESTGFSLSTSNQSNSYRRHFALEYIKPPIAEPTGGASPFATSSCSTPSWSCQSPTPVSDSIGTPTWTPLAIPQSPPQVPADKTLSHVLLNRSLANSEVNVVVNDNSRYKNKELVASIQGRYGMAIRYLKNGTSYPLEPEWVTPKYPSPTHDNGLLIFIRGEHCGKYARRIHHRHGASGILMVLAIVQPVKEAADNITGEQVTISPDHLCTVTETKEKKNLNKDLMKSLREAYRKNNPRH